MTVAHQVNYTLDLQPILIPSLLDLSLIPGLIVITLGSTASLAL
jgi:hypothetical protein